MRFRFVPIVESPGAAFIVARKEFGSESPIERLVYGFGPLLLFNVMTICLTGLLMWILVSSFWQLVDGVIDEKIQNDARKPFTLSHK